MIIKLEGLHSNNYVNSDHIRSFRAAGTGEDAYRIGARTIIYFSDDEDEALLVRESAEEVYRRLRGSTAV